MATDREANTTTRYIATTAVVLGLVLAAASLLADQIGISGGGEGIGWKQLIGAIAGLIIALAGIAVLLRPRGLTGTE